MTQLINVVSLNKNIAECPLVFLDIIKAIEQLLKNAGYAVTVSNNLIINDAINIILGAGTHLSHDYDQLEKLIAPSNSIIFNLEQIASDSPLVTSDYIEFITKYTVFDYNPRNVGELKDRGAPRVFEFPLVPCKDFATDHAANKNDATEHDFAFYGAMVSRRKSLLSSFEKSGARIKLIMNKYGPDLSAELIGCRAILNLHSYESALFESARCLRPLAMGIPVISELSRMPELVSWGSAGVRFYHPEHIVEKGMEFLANESEMDKARREAIAFVGDVNHPETARRVIDNVLHEMSKQ